MPLVEAHYGSQGESKDVYYFALIDAVDPKRWLSGAIFATGDVKVLRRGVTGPGFTDEIVANIAAFPVETAIPGVYRVTFNDTELKCQKGVATFVDQTSPPLWYDDGFAYRTFGHDDADLDGT